MDNGRNLFWLLTTSWQANETAQKIIMLVWMCLMMVIAGGVLSQTVKSSQGEAYHNAGFAQLGQKQNNSL